MAIRWGTTIAWLASWAAITWLGCYIIIWIDQANCSEPLGICMRSAFKEWLYKLIQLSWVYHYQTLIAGVVTILGAGTALIALFLQRAWKAHEDARARRQHALNLLNLAGMLFKSCAESAMRKDLNALQRDLGLLRDHISPLAAVSAGTADLVRIAVGGFEYYLTHSDGLFWVPGVDDSDHFDFDFARYISLLASLWSGFFANAERLLDAEGNFVLSKQNISVFSQKFGLDRNIDIKRLPFIMDLYE